MPHGAANKTWFKDCVGVGLGLGTEIGKPQIIQVWAPCGKSTCGFGPWFQEMSKWKFFFYMFTQSIQFEKLLVVNPWLWWFLILGAFKWLGTTLIFGNLRNYNNGSRTIGNSGTKQCRDEVFSIRRVRRKRSFYMLKLFPSYFIPIKLENHD